MNTFKRAQRANNGPSGRSFRSLRRAFNCGWIPPQPNEKAKLRHAWYRKTLAFNALREKLGHAII